MIPKNMKSYLLSLGLFRPKHRVLGIILWLENLKTFKWE